MTNADTTPPDKSPETAELEEYHFDLLDILTKLQAVVPTFRSFFGLNSYDRLPKTSQERQRHSSQETPIKTSDLLEGDLSKKVESTTKDDTVLYLAYGSNMGAKTFRGKRGIRPISQVNVLVPELSLTFDIPGLPYLEPCFAGTVYRDASAAALGENTTDDDDTDKGKWRKPLVGVVYEVTTSDFAHIIATEGGGRSYIDTLVNCHPFPPTYSPSDPVPNHPITTPLKAHTLLAPDSAAAAANEGAIELPSDGTTPLPHPESQTSGWFSFLCPGQPRRPHSGYSQPSARYLNLLINGSKEQDLPSSYREYLRSLQPYRITSTRQRIGKFLFLILWAPSLILSLQLSSLFADKDGRSPQWVASYGNLTFGAILLCYDYIFKPVFGDGERTEEE